MVGKLSKPTKSPNPALTPKLGHGLLNQITGSDAVSRIGIVRLDFEALDIRCPRVVIAVKCSRPGTGEEIRWYGNSSRHQS